MIGIDKEIDRLRAKLADKFTAISTYTAYGRAYKNTKTDGVYPEILEDGTNQYKGVLLDSGKDGLSFFVVENDYSVENQSMLSVDVSLYFAVNLSKFYPIVTERATEYLHRDVLKLIKNSKFELSAITSGLESFSDFTGVKAADNFQPYYLCKFSTNIEYNINNC